MFSKSLILYAILAILLVGSLEVAARRSHNHKTLASTRVRSSDLLNETYFNCNYVEEESNWTYVPEFDTVRCKGRMYVGPYATGDSLSATLDTSASHNGIVLMFFVALIDAWEYESFTIVADGHVVFAERSSGKRAPYDSCLNYWTDAYSNFTVGFNHSAPTLTLLISSSLEKDVDTASWGICNFTIYATTNYVDPNGYQINNRSGTTVLSTTFLCDSPAMDIDWSYIPYYQAQSCAGSTFVYFGAGGSLSTQLSITEEHLGITLGFYLAFMDSWDSETFYVTADGVVVFSVVRTFGESSANTCQNGWYDGYEMVDIGFNHTGSMLSLVFTSTLDSSSDDEAFGICALVVAIVDNYVDADGNTLDVDTDSLNALESLYFSCDSPSEDDTWTYYPAYQNITCDEYTYLGGYGKDGAISGTFYISDTHNGIIVTLNLIFIDSWDGEYFTATADGTLVYSVSHNYANSTSNICQNSWADSNVSVTFGFNHSLPLLTLEFSSTLDQVSTDEAWGICDLEITPSSYYVESNGYTVGTGSGGALKDLTFSCTSPAVDTDWAYYPYYETVDCSGNTYVGGYGTGGYISSLLYISDDHLGIVVSFSLAYLDSWDGNAFIITADGKPVYIATYSSSESTSNSCQGDANDAFESVTFGFNHTGSYLDLKFTSLLDEDADVESWGICDLSLTLTSDYVYSNGTTF